MPGERRMSLSAGPWRPATAAFPFEFWDTGGPNFASPALAWLGLRVSARADRFIGTPSRCHVDSNMSLLSGELEKLLLAVAQLLVALEQQVRDVLVNVYLELVPLLLEHLHNLGRQPEHRPERLDHLPDHIVHRVLPPLRLHEAGYLPTEEGAHSWRIANRQALKLDRIRRSSHA